MGRTLNGWEQITAAFDQNTWKTGKISPVKINLHRPPEITLVQGKTMQKWKTIFFQYKIKPHIPIRSIFTPQHLNFQPKFLSSPTPDRYY